jgi:simple sugar transport system ATP-binding protein
LLRERWMHQQAARDLAGLGIRVQSTTVPIRSLSGGQRQAVAIGRALSFGPKVLLMDEPTAALGVKEVRVVLDLIRDVSAKGTAVVLISHRLQDILEACHRIVVLYEGRNAANLAVAETSLEDLVSHIVGQGMEEA